MSQISLEESNSIKQEDFIFREVKSELEETNYSQPSTSEKVNFNEPEDEKPERKFSEYGITSEIPVTMDQKEIITAFPGCLAHISLPTESQKSVIRIKSPLKISTLKSREELLKYTEAEDKTIWEYILKRSLLEPNGHRITHKMSECEFWKQFIKDRRSRRTWESLSDHFIGDLRDTIMDLNYSMKTKMKLYYTLSIPVGREALAEFRKVAEVFLKKGNIIQYAASADFVIGRREEGSENFNDQNDKNFMRKLEENRGVPWFPNSKKYPYGPVKSRIRRLFKVEGEKPVNSEFSRPSFPVLDEKKPESLLLAEQIKLEPEEEPMDPYSMEKMIKEESSEDFKEEIPNSIPNPLDPARRISGSFRVPHSYPPMIPPHRRPIPKDLMPPVVPRGGRMEVKKNPEDPETIQKIVEERKRKIEEEKKMDYQGLAEKEMEEAFDEVVGHLKEFTSQLDELRPFLTDEQLDACLLRLSAIATDFKSESKHILYKRIEQRAERYPFLKKRKF